jgi:hypothetical protein
MARDEILSCRRRAAFGQDLIILGAANAVGVAVDDDVTSGNRTHRDPIEGRGVS